MIIYLASLARDARRAWARRDATKPEDQRTGCPPSVLSCTAWGFSCRANRFARGELLPRHFNLTGRHRCRPAVCFLRHFPSPTPWGNGVRVFYAACCRLVFGLSSSGNFFPPAIICHQAESIARGCRHQEFFIRRLHRFTRIFGLRFSAPLLSCAKIRVICGPIIRPAMVPSRATRSP